MHANSQNETQKLRFKWRPLIQNADKGEPLMYSKDGCSELIFLPFSRRCWQREETVVVED